MNPVLIERSEKCTERISKVVCHQCTLVVAAILLLLMIPILYIPLKDRDGSDWILAAIIFIAVGFLPLVCCKLARSFTKESFLGIFTSESFNKGSKHLGHCMLEVFCCPCLWIPALARARREPNQDSAPRSTSNANHRQSRRTGSDNPLFTSNESAEHAVVSIVNDPNQGHHRRSRGQTRGKQYHLGALIELACQADRKTTQRHVDGLSVDDQGVEVHNLYHLYAILSLAHQANNAKASQHYKEWSRLVSTEASTSRGRSDFYGLPTYEQAVALSHETNGIADVNVLSESRTVPHNDFIPSGRDRNVPINITIPTYEELMGIGPEINNETVRGAETQRSETNEIEDHSNVGGNEQLRSDTGHQLSAPTLPTYSEVCNENQENPVQS